jgi:hypothetical protein
LVANGHEGKKEPGEKKASRKDAKAQKYQKQMKRRSLESEVGSQENTSYFPPRREGAKKY